MTLVFKDYIKLRKHIHATNGTTGFVPTLGAIHKGHISLIERSINENDNTIVSVFLNPTQFNDKNDLANYPNTWSDDLKILESLNVGVVFTPDSKLMYPDDFSYQIHESKISKILCGAKRPGHFTGVLTVVCKLLNIVGADKAYFGEKDYQQFLLIKEMTNALFINTEIVPCQIIREKSGLALSSRNLLLSESHKKVAPNLYKIISSDNTIKKMYTLLTDLGFNVDYLEEHWGRRFAAAFLGSVRLIDNVKI